MEITKRFTVSHLFGNQALAVFIEKNGAGRGRFRLAIARSIIIVKEQLTRPLSRLVRRDLC